MMKIQTMCFSLLLSLCLSAQSDRYEDCHNAFPLCTMGTYYFDRMGDDGVVVDELSDATCFHPTTSETHALWMRWQVEKAGIVTFTISPFRDGDDLDFALFELQPSSLDCQSKQTIRCMASGANLGRAEQASDCLGATGLRLRSIDEVEMRGCQFNDDNFLKFLDAKAGASYALVVNNFDSQHGFSFFIDGTATLKMTKDCKSSTSAPKLQLVDIYPNPTDEYIHIDVESFRDVQGHLQLLDLQGKTVRHESVTLPAGRTTLTLDVRTYAPGTYLVKIGDDQMHVIDKFIRS